MWFLHVCGSTSSGSTVQRWCGTIVFSTEESPCVNGLAQSNLCCSRVSVLDNIKMKNICALNTLLWRWKGKAQIGGYIHTHTHTHTYTHKEKYITCTQYIIQKQSGQCIWTNTSQKRNSSRAVNMKDAQPIRTQGNANQTSMRYHYSSARTGNMFLFLLIPSVLKMCALVQGDAGKESSQLNICNI